MIDTKIRTQTPQVTQRTGVRPRTPGAARSGDDLAAGWAAVIPTALIAFVAVKFAAPLLAAETLTDPAEVSLKQYLGKWRPERLEHVRYIIAITVAPLAFLCAFRCLRNCSPKLLLWSAVIAQALVTAGISYSWAAEPFAYFSPRLAVVALAATAGMCLMVDRYRSFASLRLNRLIARVPAGLVIAFVVVLTAALLSPSILRDREIYAGPAVIWYHMQHTAGEFFAVAAGKTPFVDFFPQYNSLLPLILAPFFRALGANVLTYSVAMNALSFCGLMAIFFACAKLTGKPAWALLLYLPVIGLGFRHGDPAAYAPGAFNYFAVWPMRYVGPALVAAGFAAAFASPTAVRWLLLGGFAGFVAINNADFGLPALVAVLAALILSRPPRARVAVVVFAAGVVIAAVLTKMLLFQRAGAWPDLSRGIEFSKIFALYGFWMIPLPEAGLYSVVCATFLACLFVASWTWLVSPNSSLLTGLLAFTGVFGCGSLMYYVGRSHPHALTSAFVSWSFAVGLLFHAYARGFFATWQSRSRLLLAVPGLLLSFHGALFIGQLGMNLRPIVAQAERLRINDVGALARRIHTAEFVRHHTFAGEPVVLAFGLGSQIALDTGVKDVFPFSHPDSIILKSQLQQVADVIRSSGAQKVFLSSGYEHWEEIRRLLNEFGFRWAASTSHVKLWSRDPVGTSRPSVVGVPINFAIGGNAPAYQIAGWSTPEAGMTWTDGYSASVTLPTTPDAGPLMLRISSGANIDLNLPAQPVGVYVNGRHLEDLQVAGPGDFIVSIPADLAASGAVEIELRMPHAFAPAARGGSDVRVLGLSVRQIVLLQSAVGAPIDFSAGGNSDQVRLSGWTRSEKDVGALRSDGPSGKIALPTSRDPGPLVALVRMGGVPHLPVHPVEVYANERKIASLEVSDLHWFEMPIPPEAAASGIVELEFRTARAVSAQSVGLADETGNRAIYVSSVQLLQVR